MTDSMMALVYTGRGELRLEKRPVPVLQDDRDAVVLVTLSTICTSDLHILRGAVPRARPDTVLGHEFVGEVVRVGPGVRNLRPGDRVAANCISFCGDCWFCRHGYINNCERGGWELGCRIDGCQAEYVRVPFADMGLTRIPEGVTDRQALLLGDILSSGYFGAGLCEIRPGDTVAVLGAGPVGVCAMLCARLFGASRILCVEPDSYRLSLAKRRGICDDALLPSHGLEDTVRALTGGRGADAVIEAAGGADTLEIAWRIARPNAVVALVAMYEQEQILPLPSMYGKNLTFKTGGVDAVHCDRLMKLIAAGRLDASFLLTHQGPLNRIQEGYRVFEEKRDGCMKWAVTPYER